MRPCLGAQAEAGFLRYFVREFCRYVPSLIIAQGAPIRLRQSHDREGVDDPLNRFLTGAALNEASPPISCPLPPDPYPLTPAPSLWREMDGEGAAFAGGAFDGDLAAVGGDDVLDDSQT